MIALPEGQLQEAELIADAITSARGGATPKWGQELSRSSMDRRRGVVAEFALRWAFGMPAWDRGSYPSFDERDKADVGDNCEVRSTTHKHGRLPLHRGHDDVVPKIERDYVLVVLKDGLFRLAGWIPMRTAVKYWYDVEFLPGRPCMAIDQDQLYPISNLVIEENGESYENRG